MKINPHDNKSLIQGLLRIKNKRGALVPFTFNIAQSYYWARKRRRNIIVKARQKGITSLIDADQLIDCIVKATNAVVISHEQDATRRLFERVRGYVDTFKVQPVVSIDNANTMKFAKRGSSYFIGTAGQRAFGRGDTIDRAHLSEAMFYHDLERILAGVSEAAEYGTIDIESSPNGRGTYGYELYQDAKAGRSPYTPIFIPWFIDTEYSSDSLTAVERAGLSDAVQAMFNGHFEPTPDELDLIARVKIEWDIDLTPGQIKWRRYKIWDKGDMFFQEYPEDDVTCFLSSGRPVFRVVPHNREYRVALDTITDTARIDEYKRRALFAGIDAAEGTDGGDAHCCAVIDMTESPARVIWEYSSNEPFEIFDTKIAVVLNRYNIRNAVEKNGVGLAHLRELKRLGCRTREWTTNATTRPVMLVDLEQAYRKGELIESYDAARTEALDMYYDEGNRPDHPKGRHDDRVFARAIALQLSKMPVPRVG